MDFPPPVNTGDITGDHTTSESLLDNAGEATGFWDNEPVLLLTAPVFFQIIAGENVDTLSEFSSFGIDAPTEQIVKE